MESMVEKTKDETCGLKHDDDSEPCGKKATHFMCHVGAFPFEYTFLCEEHALWIYMYHKLTYGSYSSIVVDRIAAVDEMTPEEEEKGRACLKDLFGYMGITEEE